MESLSQTEWDLIISGTGLQQSLLALALSRSGKNVLHVDGNEYYGGAEAAFSLQEAEEWALKFQTANSYGQFSNSSTSKADVDEKTNASKLSFSRAYTLTLSPQIIYSRSKFLPLLVSSKVYRQLEFQAVGNWWLFGTGDTAETVEGSSYGALRRIPNGREDIFSDRSIDVRAKRGLMKFLKFVVDYENQTEVWHPHADGPLSDFLSERFSIPTSLQTAILALTLSMDLPTRTTVRYSLPRIARHLTSIGVFGPGFGAVIPKWGGGSEIAQVACRAGAVGGAIYILGKDVEDQKLPRPESSIKINLTNETSEVSPVRTKFLVTSGGWGRAAPQSIGLAITKTIAIVSSDFTPLFISSVEGGPTAAVSVVAFSSGSLVVNGEPNAYPVYIMVHSSETGECPDGQFTFLSDLLLSRSANVTLQQGILYASTFGAENPKTRLEVAISALTSCFFSAEPEKAKVEGETPRILFSLSYEQRSPTNQCPILGAWSSFPTPSLDLVFDDPMLQNVEDVWRTVMGYAPRCEEKDSIANDFMVFEDREQIGTTDEEDE